jgi:SAM-dependent methyltransferase
MSAASPYCLKDSPWSSHSRILRYLELWPRTARILDVGTADGYLGQALRNAGFENVVGMEGDSTRAAAARAAYVEVIRSDLDRPATWSLGTYFDVIICADVLEHLSNPWAALKLLVEALEPEGRLLISIPNSGHWWVRANALCGRFPLEARGLFDRGHVRFFTWSTLRELVKQAGLEIEHCWITPIPFASMREGQAAGRLALWGEAAYCGLANVWKKLLAYQFVLSARRRTE